MTLSQDIVTRHCQTEDTVTRLGHKTLSQVGLQLPPTIQSSFQSSSSHNNSPIVSISTTTSPTMSRSALVSLLRINNNLTINVRSVPVSRVNIDSNITSSARSRSYGVGLPQRPHLPFVSGRGTKEPARSGAAASPEVDSPRGGIIAAAVPPLR